MMGSQELSMRFTDQEKQRIKVEVAQRLKDEPEVSKVVIFGSFCTSPDPHDLDVAIFQDTDETYLPLAMKYRRLLRPVADRIALDVVPVRPVGAHGVFFDEIQKGEVIYER
jgi:predicted nucleotidyltransferase